MKKYLFFLYVFATIAIIFSFKLPYNNYLKINFIPTNNYVVKVAKINESKTNSYKSEEFEISKITGNNHFISFPKLIIINVLTLVLIFIVFLTKVKYFD
jgi:hypothetical protein